MDKTIYIIIGYWGNWEDSGDEIVGGYFTNYEEAVKQKQHLETVRATHPDYGDKVSYYIVPVEPCCKSCV